MQGDKPLQIDTRAEFISNKDYGSLHKTQMYSRVASIDLPRSHMGVRF